MKFYCSNTVIIDDFSFDLVQEVIKYAEIHYFNPKDDCWKKNASIYDPKLYKKTHILILEVV